MSFVENAVKKASYALSKGEIVLVIDDLSFGLPVGYVVSAAEDMTPERVCHFVNFGRGVICASLSESRMREVGLPLMARPNRDTATEFAVSIDARVGITTGISANDRSATLRALATTKEPRRDLVMPGHIFPCRARSGGVLVRSGIAEACIDLLELAKRNTVGAFIHCLNSSGDIASSADVERLSSDYDHPIVTLSALVHVKMTERSIVEQIAESALPTTHNGEFRAIAFRSVIDGAEHLALIKGEINTVDQIGLQLPICVRVQAEHGLGDLLGSGSLTSRQNIAGALQAINCEGRGVFVYIRHPRQDSLRQQTIAAATGAPITPAPSIREHGVGAQILSHIGARRIILLTNSNRSIPGLGAFNIEIVDRRPFRPLPRSEAA